MGVTAVGVIAGATASAINNILALVAPMVALLALLLGGGFAGGVGAAGNVNSVAPNAAIAIGAGTIGNISDTLNVATTSGAGSGAAHYSLWGSFFQNEKRNP